MIDKISEDRIKLLHPKIRSNAYAFLTDIQTLFGVTLRVVQGLRTFEQQAAIYGQGRTLPGKIVSNAKPGYSYHNYGLAIDVAELKPDKTINWNLDWAKVVPVAKKHGFAWGGDFKSIKDKPHFEISFGKKPSELLPLYKKGEYIPV